jgi:hypothetical protein
MASKKVLDIRWPTMGLVKKFAYRTQPPYSSPDCLNVRSSETIEGRERGGSRPGLIKSHDTLLGSGNPVRLLEQCTVVREDSVSYWEDGFQGSTLGSIWTAATWIGTAPGVTDDIAQVSATTGATGCTRDAVSDIDTSSPYQMEMYIVPYQAAHHGKYQFFLRMGAGLDPTADGVICELVLEDDAGNLSGTVKSYTGSVLTDNWSFTDPAIDSTSEPGWFKCYVNGNAITVYWRGSVVLSTQTLTEGAAGSRLGFGINCTQAGGVCLVDRIRLQYTKNVAQLQERRTHIVASSNGTVYRDNFAGEMTSISSNLTLASDRHLIGCERGGKLYVADTGTPIDSGTDGQQGSGTTKFDDAGGQDWTTLGLDIYNYQLEITNVTGGMIAGTYEISAIGATEITTSPACNSGAGTCSYRILRSPKIVDPKAGTLTQLVATEGAIPMGCDLVALYRDRLVLAGDPNNPQAWFASRQGTLTDFDYSVADTDTQRAVAATNADAGKCGQSILALMPFGDDYMIFGCTSSLWILRGDPSFGGQLDNVSRSIGIVGKRAWCNLPDGHIVFMSHDGLYILQAGSPKPQSLSRERLPEEMLDFSPALHDVLLEYDIKDRGIHIWITPKDSGTGRTHYFFDWEGKSFWPVTTAATKEPTSILMFNSDSPAESAVILGCRDGYLRKFSNLSETDDGTAFSSYCMVGPMSMAIDSNDGMLMEIAVATAQESGDVDVDILVGNTHEAAVKASAFATIECNTAGMNYRHNVRARGKGIALKLKNGESGRKWAYERATGIIRPVGRQRLF